MAGRAAGPWAVAGAGLLVGGVVAAAAGSAAGQPAGAVAAGVAGAVLGAFAPSMVGWVHRREQQRTQRLAGPGELLERGELSAAGLLNPVDTVVAFAGRHGELADLEAWADDPGGPVVRLVVAPGGYGKTRLAQQFAHRRRGDGWVCWPVRFGAETDLAAKVGGWGPGRLLIVVDYAEARSAAGLGELLAAAARADGRVRVLLLARSAGSWWRYLSSACEPHAAVLDGLTLAGNVLVLEARTDDRPPAEVIADAARQFAGFLGRPVPTVLPGPPSGVVPVLRLHTRALLAVLGDPSGGDELDLLLRHEARYWRRRAARRGLRLPDDEQWAEAVLAQTAAVAALLGAGDDLASIARLVRRTPCHGGLDDETAAGWAAWLAELYPGQDGRTGVVSPDLVAETLAAETVAGWTPTERRAVFAGIDEDQAVQALTVLGRAADHHHEMVAAVLDDVLAADLALMVAAVIGTGRQFPGRYTDITIRLLATRPDALAPAQARRLAALVPYPSLELHRLAVALGEAASRTGEETDDSADRAAWLNGHAIRLGEAGRRAEALAVAREAVDLCRELVAVNRDAYLPNLATSVNNLAGRLGEAGRRAEALAVAQEAVDLYRELVAVNRDAYLPDLAMSISNLAVFLGEVGQRAEGLAVAQEAVDLYRELVAVNRDAYLPNLAMSISNLAADLGEVRRWAEGLLVAQEAVELRRGLVAVNRDAHLPDLAMSINNLAVLLATVGRRTEALAVAREAVELRRELVAVNRDAHLPDLAMSINNLAVDLAEAERRADALAAAQEAVDLRRELVAVNREAYLPNLAMSINNLAVRLAAVGRRPEGLTAAQEAVELYQELAAGFPMVFGELLQSALDLRQQLTAPGTGPPE